MVTLDRYQKQNAAFKIQGYFFPKPSERDEGAAAFERAKTECIENLKKEMECIEVLTLEQFKKHK